MRLPVLLRRRRYGGGSEVFAFPDGANVLDLTTDAGMFSDFTPLTVASIGVAVEGAVRDDLVTSTSPLTFSGLGADEATPLADMVLATGTTGTWTASGDNYVFEDTVGGQTRPGVQFDTTKSPGVYRMVIPVIAITGASQLRIDGIGVDYFPDVGTHEIIVRLTTSLAPRLRLEDLSSTIGDGFELGPVTFEPVPGIYLAQSNSSFRAVFQGTPNRLVFDGIDDRYDTGLNPTTTGSIVARFRGGTASRIAVGSQGASDGRAYVGLASDGAVAGGVGTQATSTIKGTTDQTGEWVTVALTWDGSTVSLYENGTSVYSAAQSGAVNTTVPFMVGALNANGTASAFWDDDITNVYITDEAITAADAASIHNLWSS